MLLKMDKILNFVEIVGNGNTNFIGDTRSGPINVDITNREWICEGVGLSNKKG